MKAFGRMLVRGLALLGIAGAMPAGAQVPSVRTTFVPLAPGVPGVLYEPVAIGPRAAIGVFIMHSSADYLAFPACTELSRRGYRVLCANNSTGKSGASNDGMLDRILLEARAAIAYLRAYPGIASVVLLGHSGGGTVMSAYQMIAEGGVAACRGPAKIWQCPDSLAGLPPADGLMLLDTNWGLAAMTLFSLDPAVVNADSGMVLDPALDMFDPKNGFRPAGSRYTPAFTRRFLAAGAGRMNALIARARDRLAAIDAGKGRFADDEPFVVPGAVLLAGNNKLLSQDVTLLSRTKREWPLLRADGTATPRIVRSVRVPENRENLSPSLLRGALKTSVRNFLSTYAIRTRPEFHYDADSIEGVDWTSSYASPPGNVEGVAVPLLALGMTGHWEALAAELVHDHAKSADKTLAFVEGADHGYRPCRACETVPGQFGDTMKTTFDYVDGWLARPGRFLAAAAPDSRAARP